jgi:uncharacterized protein with NAD-binding domain and iron-sulfur cluster
VRFQFFHRLENVGLAADAPAESAHVESLTFDVQARTTSGGEYQPLVDVRGLPCWPAEPRWAELAGGAAMQREGRRFESHWDRGKVDRQVLRVGQDFDLVVLAVGAGALPFVCGELIEREPRWRTMIERVKTVPTQALQLWLREDARGLGWRDDKVNISAFVEPFDTWADMSQLVSEESFATPVGSIAYFCSVLPDAAPGVDTGATGYPARRREEVRANAQRFLERDIRQLWPGAMDARGQFRWELLVDAQPPAARRRETPEAGPARLAGQFWTANVNPSDRYTLSLPGSLQHRISPLHATCDNLTVAGDWTNCGFNEGCVEAAVMSGRLAAHALCESPALEEIVGFDHP